MKLARNAMFGMLVLTSSCGIDSNDVKKATATSDKYYMYLEQGKPDSAVYLVGYNPNFLKTISLRQSEYGNIVSAKLVSSGTKVSTDKGKEIFLKYYVEYDSSYNDYEKFSFSIKDKVLTLGDILFTEKD